MSSESAEAMLARLQREQQEARDKEVYGCLSPAEQKACETRADRIRYLQAEVLSKYKSKSKHRQEANAD